MCNHFIRTLSIFLITCILSACVGETVYAPVTEISSIEPLPKNGLYQVKQDDTLYSIAWRYGLDYRYLTKTNNIPKPYHIETGQILYLRAGRIKSSPRPAKAAIKIHASPQEQKIEQAPTASVSFWQLPARGPIISNFTELNKGINIGGALGTPIHATASGVVVYAGDALKAYGNLIIIKHNSVFLSAYAHNSKLLVKEGDSVKAGQQIAEMGDTGASRVMLHFEIRRGGKPVNPLSYLVKK